MVRRRRHAPLGVVMLLATPVSGCTPGHALLAPDVAHAEESDIVTVEVDGFGDTADSAMDNALRTALQEAVGTLVDAQDAVANDQLIQSQVLSRSDGFIERVETLAPAAPDNALGGLWKCRVRASVRRGAIARTLDAIPAVQAQVRGMQLWAQAVSGAQTVEDGRRLLKAFDEERPLHRLLVARIVDAKEQPVAMSGVERVPNYDKGTTTLRFGVQIFEDTAMFYERYAEPLTRLLDKVATVVKPSVVWSSQPQGACVVPGDRYSIGFPYQTRESGGEDTRSALVVVPTGRNANASSVRLRVYRVAGDAYRSSDVPQAALYAPEIAWSKLESRGYAALRSVVDVVVRVQGAERNLILEKRIRPFDYVPGSGGAEDARHRVTMYYAPGVGFVPWAEYLRSDDDTLHAELVGSSRAAYWGGICQATTMPFAVELPNETLKDVAFLTVELRPREGAQ